MVYSQRKPVRSWGAGGEYHAGARAKPLRYREIHVNFLTCTSGSPRNLQLPFAGPWSVCPVCSLMIPYDRPKRFYYTGISLINRIYSQRPSVSLLFGLLHIFSPHLFPTRPGSLEKRSLGKKVCYKINHRDVPVQKNEIIPRGAGTLVSLQGSHQLRQLFLKLCCQ